MHLSNLVAVSNHSVTGCRKVFYYDCSQLQDSEFDIELVPACLLASPLHNHWNAIARAKFQFTGNIELPFDSISFDQE